MTSETQTGRHWDAVSRAAPSPILKWGHIPQIREEIGRRICGEALSSHIEADCRFIREFTGRASFDRAVSIGCGNAGKEIWMLKQGIVRHFDLYDLSSIRIENCRKTLTAQGLEGRASTFNVSPFEGDVAAGYDLVFWSDSLHHMAPMDEVMEWSKKVLNVGGVFYFHEYIGPDRIQFPENDLALANAIRGTLDARFFASPEKPGQLVSRRISNIPRDELVAADPSESIESSRILAAFKRSFEQRAVRPLGGLVWFLGLKNLYQNFDNEEGRPVLAALLDLDLHLSRLGLNYMAVGCGIK